MSEKTCPCPCGRPVKPGNKVAGAGCSGRMIFSNNPKAKAWAKRGGAASGRRRHRELLETAKDLTPIQALALGMRIGFNRAEKRWKRWAELHVRRVA